MPSPLRRVVSGSEGGKWDNDFEKRLTERLAGLQNQGLSQYAHYRPLNPSGGGPGQNTLAQRASRMGSPYAFDFPEMVSGDATSNHQPGNFIGRANPRNPSEDMLDPTNLFYQDQLSPWWHDLQAQQGFGRDSEGIVAGRGLNPGGLPPWAEALGKLALDRYGPDRSELDPSNPYYRERQPFDPMPSNTIGISYNDTTSGGKWGLNLPFVGDVENAYQKAQKGLEVGKKGYDWAKRLVGGFFNKPDQPGSQTIAAAGRSIPPFNSGFPHTR